MASVDKMEFKATDYPNLFLKGMYSIFRSKEFIDVQLFVGNRTFCGHRNVLSAASPYFHAMFTSELLEKGKHKVEIHDIKPEIFEVLLEFIYSGLYHQR